MTLQCNIVLAQQSEILFSDTNLDQVIKSIEKSTDLIFNYDPHILKSYTFDGTLDTSQPEKAITKLLYNTPLEYSINKLAILIYRPEPKTYTLCGTIKGAKSKDPLIGVNVIATKTFSGTQTNQNGLFELSITADKNAEISFSYIGYVTLSYQIQDLVNPNCNTIELPLDEEMWKEEIVITDYILDGVSDDGAFNSYMMNYERLSKNHSIVEHDVLKTSQLLPGISSLDESATNLQIRGSTADQNLILWEGAPIYQPGHLFGMISAINPFSIHNVNIHKGVYDPKYDNRVGGIIDISLTDSIDSLQHGSAGMTLTEAHVNMEIPIISEKLEVFLSGRQGLNSIFRSPPLQNYTNKVFQFSKIDDQSQDAKEGTLNADQGLHFYDWNTKFLFKPLDRALINVGFYRNSQDFKYQLSFPEDPFNATDKILAKTEALKTKIDWAFNESWTSSFSFVQSKYKSEYAFLEEEEGEILSDNIQYNDITDRSFIISNTIKTSSIIINSGYDYNEKLVNYNIVRDNIYEPYFEDKIFEKGSFHNVFASIDMNHKKYNISGGVRASYYVEQDRWVSSPRFSIEYLVNTKLTLKAEGGIFHQFISQLSENSGNTIAVDYPLWILNNSGQELSQRANKIAAGFKYRNRGWLFDLEMYYNKTNGLSTLSPLFNLLVTDEFARGNSKAIGLGLLLKKRWDNFNSWINYSLGQINYSFPEISESTFYAPNDIRHNISVVGSYDYRSFQFSIVGNFHSGLPYTRASGIETIYDEEDDENFYNIEYNSLNENRLKPYSRVDFSINYRPEFKLLRNAKIEFSLSILNLWNSKNVFAREYYLESDDASDSPNLAFIRKSLLQTTPLMLCRIYW